MTVLDERDNPFVGLRPFFDEDALYFFGRKDQTLDLLDLLRESRFVPVLGSSGSGKSSLVRAGLLPLLQAGFMVADRDGWRMAKCRPGDAPLENVAEALQYAMGDGRVPAEAARLAQLIREEHVDAVLEYLRPRLSSSENVFLLVDQFEELFAFRSAAGGEGDDDAGGGVDPARTAERIRRRQDAASLVSLLLALSQQTDIPLYVSITMRTDFLGDCDLFTGLPEAINRSGYLVPRLTRTQLREAVVGPPRLMGARVAPRLVDRVLNDVGDRGDRLPVMQHALLRTWAMWQAEGAIGPLDIQHFDEAGGLEHSLDRQAEETIAAFDPGLVERVFKRLTTTDVNRRRVRSPARFSELLAISGSSPAVLTGLLDRCRAEGVNFLYAAPDGRPGDPRYDIVHESLIRQWTRLRGWVDEERDAREWWLEMSRKAQADAESPGADLLSPRALQGALERLAHRPPTAEWAARYGGAGGAPFDTTMAYIVRSRDAATRRRQRRLRWVGATVLGFVVLGVYGAYNGWLADNTLNAARNSSRRVAIERLVIDDPTYAMALAAEFDTTDLKNPATMALAQRVLAGAVATAEFAGIDMVAISDDGFWLALAAADSVVLRRTDSTGESIRVSIPSSVATALRFSRDGTALLFGTMDGTVRRIRLSDGQVQNTWPVSSREVRAVLESPDGRRLVAMVGQGSLFTWASTAAQVDSLPLPDATAAEFLPTEGAVLLVGTRQRGQKVLRVNLEASSTKAPVVLDADTSEHAPTWLVVNPVQESFVVSWDNFRTSLYSGGRRRVNLDSSLVSSAAFSPDGQLLAIGTALGTVELYDASRLSRRWRIEPHTQYVVSVGFSRSSDAVVSLSSDRTGRWTAVSDSSAFVRLNGHREDPATLLMAPDGARFITRDFGGTVRVWEPPNDLGDFRPAFDTEITAIAMSDDGRAVVTGYADGSVLANFPANDQVPTTMPGSADLEGPILALAVSPDGRRVFVGANDGTAPLIWNLSDSTVTPLALPEGDAIVKAVFSGDGRTLLAASADGSVIRADGLRGTKRDTVTGCAGPFSVGEMAVSHNGDRVAVWCNGGTTVVIHTPTDTLTQALESISPVRTLRFGPDSTSLMVAGVGSFHLLIDTRGRDRFLWLEGKQWEVYSAAFSRDGGMVATAGYDKTVELFEVPPLGEPDSDGFVHGKLLLNGHRFPVLHVAFGATARTIVSTGRDGTVHLWQRNDDEKYVGTMLAHPRPLPPSPYVEQVASAYLSGPEMIVSLALSTQDLPERRQRTLTRYRRWSLSPQSMEQLLKKRSTVCMPLPIRINLIPVEEEVAEERTAACLKRIGRAAN